MELVIDNLSKSYGNKKALTNVSCTLTEGVYGLLGANGAGKSTLMNIITGSISADSGRILWNGENILGKKQHERFCHILGYMPQYPVLYRGFTVWEFLSYVAILRGMGKKQTVERLEWALDFLGLTENRNRKVTALSGGMKQRLMLAQAVIGDPKVLILDEPTAGLDPKQRIAVRNLISEIAFDKIVIIATHIVTDIEFISNEIVLLKNGELIQKAEREVLIQNLNGKVYELQVELSQLSRVQQSYLVGNIVKERELLYVRVVSDTVPDEKNKRLLRPTLEDVYLYYFCE